MIVYLDQNKWIQLARIENGLVQSVEAKKLIEEINVAQECGYIFPLSEIHFLEFSRIKDHGRRSRLGKVMWKYSQGFTIAPLKEIICRELEVAFAEFGYNIKPRVLNYVGQGINHAFGATPERNFSSTLSKKIDEAMLCGYKEMNPISYNGIKHRKGFTNHLRYLNKTKKELDKSKWEDWLYAMSMIDIHEPIKTVMISNQIQLLDIKSWGKIKIKQFLDLIPTRRLDIHLHRQVLRNPKYKPKHNDLEDWAGLGPAMCYCDVVVCEKHFANIVARDNFKTKARVEKSIHNLFLQI